MEQPINNLLHQLAKRLNLINSEDEPEPYLLTKEEEAILIKNAIEAEKNQLKWKMTELGFSALDFDNRAAEIDWEARIDQQKLFNVANLGKNHELWAKEQRKKEKEEEERKALELKKSWGARRVYQLMAWTSREEYGKPLIVNNDNKHLITTLCFFISRDERFETELGYSFNKGLLIRGISGIGKTHLVKCIEKNQVNPILILSMLDITHEIKENGGYLIKTGSNKILYLDDVGTEQPVVNHYGTKITFVKDFIEGIYLRSKCFNHLILSTNNSFSEMEERYGFRVRSRMKDMFNIIDVKGIDMRG